MPGVFSRMNSLLQEEIQGMNLQDINKVLPSGIIEAKETFVKSKPIPPENSSFISGRLDVLSRLEDGSLALIDFKISNQDEEKAQKFKNQLHAYKYALENPLSGIPKRVTKMGLIVVSPDAISFEDGHVIFKTKPSWFEIRQDMDSFYSFASEVSRLLSRPQPEPTKTCKWCIYRTHFQTESSDSSGQEDIPF